MEETVKKLLNAATTSKNADEVRKYVSAAKTVAETYKLVEGTKLAEKKTDDEHEARMFDIQCNADKRKEELNLEKEKLNLEKEKLNLEKEKLNLEKEKLNFEKRKWYDLTPRELAANNKDKVVEGLKVIGSVITAIAGGYIGYKTAERKNETVKYGINAATNFSQSDVLNGKPLEVVDRAAKIADD